MTDVVGGVLVIGGGIAGIQASLDLAEMGFKVYLVEKSPSIGGRMAQLDKTFPTNDCSLCILAPKMVEVYRHPNIELLTYSEVKGLDGDAGNFDVKVLRKARYVSEEKCTGCGICTKKCPMKNKYPDEFNAGLGKRGAAYIAFPQAVPPVAVIDEPNCLYFQKGICKACQKLCPANAIDFEMKDEEITLNVGAIIVTTGFEQIPKIPAQYGIKYDNVLSGLEFERLMCASGPTGGSIERVSDGKHPHKIAMISCVGSRNSHLGVPYCSSVCCMYIAKECIITKEHAPDIDLTVFKSDVRSYGKGFNEYIERAKKEYGVNYITGRIGFVEEDPLTKNLILSYEDMESGESKQMEAELVVLAVGLTPSAGATELAKILGITLDENKFFTEASEVNPVETSRPGIYVCGYAQGPKDIPESVADASGAAGKAAELLAPARGQLITTDLEEVPMKEVKPEDEPRIGVMICHCGTNIGGIVRVPEVVEYAKNLPNVVYAEGNLYSCSSDSQQKIKELIKEHDLNRFVVASCTPRTHESLFANTCAEGGLNPYLFELVNIRDQCSWVHMTAPDDATEKSKDLVRMAVAKSRLLKPLKKGTSEITQSALVIGAGISGITAALSIANEGYKVYLMTNEDKLGGLLNKLHKIYPSGKKASEILDPLLKQVESNKNIEVFTSTNLGNVRGYIGNYDIELKSSKLGDFSQKVGVFIVATGGKELKPEGYVKYGEYDNVITQTDLEEMLNKGTLNKNIKDITFMLCAHSREAEGKFTYCSKICCSVAIKNAMLLKEMNSDININILYRDIQMAGKESEEFYRKSRGHINYINYSLDKLPDVNKNSDNTLNIKVYNVLNRENIELKSNLLVLTTPMVPNEGVEEISQHLKVPTMKDIPPFFLEAHVKLRPLDFATDGVFLCGAAQWPKGIEECVSQALGAAARAKRVLSKDIIETEGSISHVDPNKCIGCGLCAQICPYKAIQLEEEDEIQKAHVIEVSCKGCGLCGATCPMKAISIYHFTDEQLLSQVKNIYEEGV